jgi:hypothetical protein
VEKTGAFPQLTRRSGGAKLGSKHATLGPLAGHYVHSALATVLCRPHPANGEEAIPVILSPKLIQIVSRVGIWQMLERVNILAGRCNMLNK